MNKLLKKIFNDPGLRFLFTTRSAVPNILDDNGKDFFGKNYQFIPDKDEVIREGDDIFIVSYGEMLYRALDAVERLNKKKMKVGLINKPTLNTIDKSMMKKLSKAKVVLVVESQNQKTGLGIRFGTWLLKYGFKGNYAHIGTTKIGNGGLSEQIPYQGLDPKSIIKKLKELF